MQINLVQLDADTAWKRANLSEWLGRLPAADLTVFPECFPFETWDKPVSETVAVRRLQEAGARYPEVTFIAGGYITETGRDGAAIVRNRAFLVHRGFVVDAYDKQICYQDENFTPGRLVKVFAWGEHRCVPLICADADQGPKSKFMADLVTRAMAAGAGQRVPIVVASYGAMLTEPYWTDSLEHLARSCQAPVAICGVAGVSKWTFRYHKRDGGDGQEHHYGGGGSALYVPKGKVVKAIGQPKEPGILRVDTARGSSRFEAFV